MQFDKLTGTTHCWCFSFKVIVSASLQLIFHSCKNTAKNAVGWIPTMQFYLQYQYYLPKNGEHSVTGALLLARIKHLEVFSPPCRAVLPTPGHSLRKLQPCIFMAGFNFSCQLMTVHLHKVLSRSLCVQIWMSVPIMPVYLVFHVSYHVEIRKLSALYLWELFCLTLSHILWFW